MLFKRLNDNFAICIKNIIRDRSTNIAIIFLINIDIIEQ